MKSRGARRSRWARITTLCSYPPQVHGTVALLDEGAGAVPRLDQASIA